MTVGELAFWNNPADQIGGMPWKEGGGPLSKLLSGGDTSTNSLSHPIHLNIARVQNWPDITILNTIFGFGRGLDLGQG